MCSQPTPRLKIDRLIQRRLMVMADHYGLTQSQVIEWLIREKWATMKLDITTGLCGTSFDMEA